MFLRINIFHDTAAEKNRTARTFVVAVSVDGIITEREQALSGSKTSTLCGTKEPLCCLLHEFTPRRLCALKKGVN